MHVSFEKYSQDIYIDGLLYMFFFFGFQLSDNAELARTLLRTLMVEQMNKVRDKTGIFWNQKLTFERQYILLHVRSSFYYFILSFFSKNNSHAFIW